MPAGGATSSRSATSRSSAASSTWTRTTPAWTPTGIPGCPRAAGTRRDPWDERGGMRAFTYDALPGRVVFGVGASAGVAGEVDRLPGSRVLVVSDPMIKPVAFRLAAQP